MNKRRYDKEMDEIIKGLDHVPTLLLHSCCAPCSSACLEKLTEYFKITVFYYNPNITDSEEYKHRTEEVQRLIREIPCKHDIDFLEGPYDPENFYKISKGLEMVPEGGERCERCFRLRLSESAKAASEGNFDYYTTTLTISPLKNAALLNEIGEEMAAKHGCTFLPSDFKKRDGYKRSIELSREYDLYRQNFCGCVYSKEEALRREQEKSAETQ